MCLFGNNDNGSNWWIWIVIILIIVFCSDGNVLGSNNCGCCCGNNNCGCNRDDNYDCDNQCG